MDDGFPLNKECDKCGYCYRTTKYKTCPKCALMPTSAIDQGKEIHCEQCGCDYYDSSFTHCPVCAGVVPEHPPNPQTCLNEQVGGTHYHQGMIQPINYIHGNDLNFFEGNAIKYITRNRRKGTPVEDIKKAIHYLQLQLMLEHNIDSMMEYRDAVSGNRSR